MRHKGVSQISAWGSALDIDVVESTLRLRGDLDVRSTWEVRAALHRILALGGEHEIVVDLTDVSSVDLTALRMLAVATRDAQRSGRLLRLRGCCPRVRRFLHISRLRPVLEVEPVLAG